MTSPDSLRRAFDDAIADLKKCLGDENVFTQGDEIERRSRCTTPWEKSCTAVIYPGSTEEVQSAVRVCAAHRLTLWPFSKGKNWGYSSSLSLQDGSIVMILERMDRILEVNEELAYAVIERGVTYLQLNQHLRQRGIKLWADCTDGPPDGSVLGNALERGLGETPYGDHFANLCGLEVVLPDGELLYTGGGPGKNFKTWNTHKWGVGPFLEGIFSQSNLGVVTRAGLWLMPEPADFGVLVFDMHSVQGLPDVLEKLQRLALAGAVQTKLHIINDLVALALVAQKRDLTQEPGPLSEQDLAALRRRYGLAPWSFAVGLYGDKREVRLMRRKIEEVLAPFGRFDYISKKRLSMLRRVWPLLKRGQESPRWKGLTDKLVRAVFKKSMEVLEAAPHLYDILQGAPTEFFVRHAYFRSPTPRPRVGVDPIRDNVGLIWFAPIVPFLSRNILEILTASQALFRKFGFDFYVAVLMTNPRSVVPLMSIFYAKEDRDETARARSLYEALCAMMTDLGYQEYRSGIGRWDHLYDHAPGYKTFLDRVKSAVDPHLTIAPGRYGVGPAGRPE